MLVISDEKLFLFITINVGKAETIPAIRNPGISNNHAPSRGDSFRQRIEKSAGQKMSHCTA
jgi:hypothetical protein